MAQNVFFGLTGVVKCIKSGQIIVISHDLGPQKVAMTGKWDPLFQVLPGSPENPKNPSFFLSATVWGGGKFCCQDLVKFLLRKYASPQAFTPEGASQREFGAGGQKWRTHLTG